jgi:choline-glycine betaine transporter
MAAPMSYGSSISGLDKGLAIAAAVCGLAFLIHVVVIALGITLE